MFILSQRCYVNKCIVWIDPAGVTKPNVPGAFWYLSSIYVTYAVGGCGDGLCARRLSLNFSP